MTMSRNALLILSKLHSRGRSSSCSCQYPVTGNVNRCGGRPTIQHCGVAVELAVGDIPHVLRSAKQHSPVLASPYLPTLSILPSTTTFTQPEASHWRMVSTWSVCQLSSPRSAILHHRVLLLGVRQCHFQEEDVPHRQLPSNLSKEKTQCRCFMNLLPSVILSPVMMPRNQRRTLIFFLREGDVIPEILSLMLVPASPASLSLTAHAQYIYL